MIREALQELDLPLTASSWSEEDRKDPKKLYEMTVLLNAQREIADQILDSQWERKWREEKFSDIKSFKCPVLILVPIGWFSFEYFVCSFGKHMHTSCLLPGIDLPQV